MSETADAILALRLFCGVQELLPRRRNPSTRWITLCRGRQTNLDQLFRQAVPFFSFITPFCVTRSFPCSIEQNLYRNPRAFQLHDSRSLCYCPGTV